MNDQRGVQKRYAKLLVFCKLLITGLLLVILTSSLGCLTARKQAVTGQLYTCTRGPSVQIIIDNSMQYGGNFKVSTLEKWPDWSDVVDYDLYFFGKSRNRILVSGVVIISKTFNSSESSWKPNCSFVKRAFVNE